MIPKMPNIDGEATIRSLRWLPYIGCLDLAVVHVKVNVLRTEEMIILMTFAYMYPRYPSFLEEKIFKGCSINLEI